MSLFQPVTVNTATCISAFLLATLLITTSNLKCIFFDRNLRLSSTKYVPRRLVPFPTSENLYFLFAAKFIYKRRDGKSKSEKAKLL